MLRLLTWGAIDGWMFGTIPLLPSWVDGFCEIPGRWVNRLDILLFGEAGRWSSYRLLRLFVEVDSWTNRSIDGLIDDWIISVSSRFLGFSIDWLVDGLIDWFVDWGCHMLFLRRACPTDAKRGMQLMRPAQGRTIVGPTAHEFFQGRKGAVRLEG